MMQIACKATLASHVGDREAKTQYAVFIKINDQSFEVHPDCLKALESRIINKLIDNLDWRINSLMGITLLTKTITLPVSIEPLVFERIRTFSGELAFARQDSTNKKVKEIWTVDLDNGVRKLLGNAYEQRTLVSVVRMVEALELLECDRLIQIVHKVLESLQKDKQFLASWQAAVHRVKAYQSAPMHVQAGMTDATFNYVQIAQLTGDYATWCSQKNLLAVNTNDQVRFYNTATKQLSCAFDGYVMSVSPDGSKALMAQKFFAGPIKMVDLQIGTEMRTFSGYKAHFIGNGDTILICLLNPSGNVYPSPIEIRRTCDGQLIRSSEQLPQAYYASFSLDGTKMLTSIPGKHSIVFDLAQEKRLFTCPGWLGVFSSDGSKVAVHGREGSLFVTSVYNVNNGQLLDEFGEKRIAFSGDARRLATIIQDLPTGDYRHIVRDLASRQVVATMPGLGDFLQFMPGDNTKALVVIYDKQQVKLALYDLTRNQKIYEFDATWGAFSSDGSYLVVQNKNEITIFKNDPSVNV